MIVGIFGLPGAGKSLEAVRRAGLAHSDPSVHVYSNTPLRLTERYTYLTPQTLASVRPGFCECGCTSIFVLLDEVHLWLDSRRSMRLPVSWLRLFSQTRKRHWDLFYTAQRPQRVDVVLRGVTEYMVLARARSFPVESYLYQWFEADGFLDPAYRIRKDFRRRSAAASALYDTEFEVEEADHLRDGKDPYAGGWVSAADVASSPASGTRPGVPGTASPRPVEGPSAGVPVPGDEWRF